MYWKILFVRKDCFWIQDKVFCTLQTMDRKKMSLEDLKNSNIMKEIPSPLLTNTDG